MGLHPGRTSLGCVTVRAPTYNSDACWQRIRRVIDSGNMYYRGSSYSGFLFVSWTSYVTPIPWNLPIDFKVKTRLKATLLNTVENCFRYRCCLLACWPYWNLARVIGHFRVAQSLCFRARLKCKAIDMKWIFISNHANKTHFHTKGFALILCLSKWKFSELGNGLL